MKPTLSELQDAIPHRGTGAPARSHSHYEAILALLRERGSRGVLGSELYAHPELCGRSPRNRISELRRDGCLIEGKAHGASDWWYRLIRDNAGVKPVTDSSDWYTRQTGKPRPGWQARPFSEKRMADPNCFRLTPPEPSQ